MHNKKIAHRDLKLENILLAGFISSYHKHCSIRVTDFGLSSIGKSLTFSRPGTRYTMAPEMLSSTSPYDPFKADVWAVGVIGFCLLNGNYPFEFRETTMNQVREQQREFWRKRCIPSVKINTKAYTFLEKSLSPDTRTRPNAEEMSKIGWLVQNCNPSEWIYGVFFWTRSYIYAWKI